MIAVQKRFSRVSVVCAIAILGILYVAADKKMTAEVGISNQPQWSVSESHGVGMTAGMDVPPEIGNSVMSEIKGLPGLDEVVVLPATSGGGYQVSVTVNLGYGNDFDPNQDRGEIQQTANQFFDALYRKDNNVQDAQIYFLADGATVAGAGLGLEAYQRMSEQTISGQAGGLISAIASSTQSSNSSPTDAWFEMEQRVAP